MLNHYGAVVRKYVCIDDKVDEHSNDRDGDGGGCQSLPVLSLAFPFPIAPKINPRRGTRKERTKPAMANPLDLVLAGGTLSVGIGRSAIFLQTGQRMADFLMMLPQV